MKKVKRLGSLSILIFLWCIYLKIEMTIDQRWYHFASFSTNSALFNFWNNGFYRQKKTFHFNGKTKLFGKKLKSHPELVRLFSWYLDIHIYLAIVDFDVFRSRRAKVEFFLFYSFHYFNLSLYLSNFKACY